MIGRADPPCVTGHGSPVSVCDVLRVRRPEGGKNGGKRVSSGISLRGTVRAKTPEQESKKEPGRAGPFFRSESAEVSFEQALECLAVTGFVLRHFVDGVASLRSAGKEGTIADDKEPKAIILRNMPQVNTSRWLIQSVFITSFLHLSSIYPSSHGTNWYLSDCVVFGESTILVQPGGLKWHKTKLLVSTR